MKIKAMPGIKVRNTHATAPIMKKGGVHQTETAHSRNKKSRASAKQSLKSHKWD